MVEAILSGAVTDDPQLGRTTVEGRCADCGRALDIQWENGSVEMLCQSCERRWERSWGRVGGPQEAPEGYLGRLPFPPAGLEHRSPSEILQTAYLWTNLELLAVASGLCPRCAATVERELHICDDHDSENGPCSVCGAQHAVRLSATCTNCIYSVGCTAAWGTLPSPELLAFLFEHDLNPLAPTSVHRLDQVLNGYEEAIHSRDPFRATFEFAVDGDSLRLDVDETLSVVETTR